MHIEAFVHHNSMHAWLLKHLGRLPDLQLHLVRAAGCTIESAVLVHIEAFVHHDSMHAWL